MSDFKWFRDTATGMTGKYPAHFAGQPNFEEVSSSEAPCVDCGLDVEDEPEVEAPAPEPEPVENLPVEVETPKTIMERFKNNG